MVNAENMPIGNTEIGSLPIAVVKKRHTPKQIGTYGCRCICRGYHPEAYSSPIRAGSHLPKQHNPGANQP